MPRYRVRDGAVFGCNGVVHEAGAVVELSRAIASDVAVSGLVQEVDTRGEPVPPAPADDLARFRTHERVSVLRDRLADAQRAVDGIASQLAAEEQRLIDEVRATTAARSGVTPKSQPAAAASPAAKEN